jgi:caspase domain-containing protein
VRQKVLGIALFVGLVVSAKAAGAAEARIALVIGNGDYAAGRLANAVLDARSMAETLRGLGF